MRRLDMMPNKENGLLITFCGLDGCGKTTMLSMVREYLNRSGLLYMQTKQPTPFVRESAIFRNFMDTPNHDAYDYRSLSLLCASDRVQHSNRMILPALKRGEIVLSDRYYYSCLANLRARGYTKDEWIYEIARSIPKPDLAFFLNIDVETAVSRVRSRPEEKDRYIDMDLQVKLHQEYIDIAKANDGILIPSDLPAALTFECVCSSLRLQLESKGFVKNSIRYA